MKKSTKILIITASIITVLLLLIIGTLIIETNLGSGPITSIKYQIYYNSIPSDEKAMVNAYNEKHHYKYGYAATLYGKFENGAIVADMESMSSSTVLPAISEEIVAGYLFWFSHVNRIEVFYKGELYTLTYAYENGILTEDDIASIHKVHTK